MLLKNKSSNKSQLALMAGLTLGTITTPTLVNAVHASPSIVQAIKQSPFHITNLVTINASASVVKNVPANSYGVDVSDYQGNDMSIYAKHGAKFVIIKLAEGYYPSAGGATASAKVSSALANNMMVMGYHFYHYNGSVADAQRQAQVAIDAAKAAGVPQNSYIALDWESEYGRGENCGSTAENTQEALAWMRAVRQAGYLPMLYTGTAYLNAHFNKSTILNEFPGSFWVAYYPYSTYNHPSYSAPMESFPSMDGIAIWQFSNDMYGLHTDGNINVLPLNFLQPVAPSKPATVTTTVRLIDTNDNNKVISTQTVSGEKGSQHNINIPAHYNSSTNKVTNNGGTVDIKLTHQTAHATKTINYEVTGGSYWIHIPDNLLRKYPTIATGPLYHATKPITLQGTKDLVTGQTTWSAEPKPEDVFSSIINNNPHPDYGTVVTHPDSSNPHSIYINTVYDYNKLTDAQKQEIFPESVQSSSASNTPVGPSSSTQSNSASSSTPSSDVQSSSANSSTPSSNTPNSSTQSSSAGSNTPSSSDQSSSANSSTPSSSAQSSSASSSTPSSSAQSSSASLSAPSSPAQSSSASLSTPSFPAQSSSANPSTPSSPAQSSSASLSTPNSSTQSNSANSSTPNTPAQSSSTSLSTPNTATQSHSAQPTSTKKSTPNSSVSLKGSSGTISPNAITNNNLAQTSVNNAIKQNNAGVLFLAMVGSTLMIDNLVINKKKKQ